MSKKKLFTLVFSAVLFFSAFVAVPSADAEKNVGIPYLVGNYDQNGTLWVYQDNLPFAFKHGYGHLFSAAAVFDKNSNCAQYGLNTCEGALGYAHGTTPGSAVDGFNVKPDPNHPGAFLYFIQVPQKINPKIESKG